MCRPAARDPSSRDPPGLIPFTALPALPGGQSCQGPPPPAPPSLGHMIETDRALQPPACSALAAGRGAGAASAVRARHHRNLNISPMVPRGLPLIGWAGGRCVIQSRWRSARRLEASGGRLLSAPGATERGRSALRLSSPGRFRAETPPWLPSASRATVALRRRRRARTSRWWCGAGRRGGLPGPGQALAVGPQQGPSESRGSAQLLLGGSGEGEPRDASPRIALFESPPLHPNGARYSALGGLSETLIVRAVWRTPVASGDNRHFRKITAAVNNLLQLNKA